MSGSSPNLGVKGRTIADCNGTGLTGTAAGSKHALDVILYDSNGNALVTEKAAITSVTAPSAVSVSTSSVEVLAEDEVTKGGWLQNNGEATCYLEWGATATVANGYKLFPGASLNLDFNNYPVAVAINAICDTGDSTTVVVKYA